MTRNQKIAMLFAALLFIAGIAVGVSAACGAFDGNGDKPAPTTTSTGTGEQPMSVVVGTVFAPQPHCSPLVPRVPGEGCRAFYTCHDKDVVSPRPRSDPVARSTAVSRRGAPPLAPSGTPRCPECCMS